MVFAVNRSGGILADKTPAVSKFLPAASPAEKIDAFFRGCSASLHRRASTETDPLYQTHFKNSREAIVEAAAGLTGTALVVGVGGAHDIPLAELAKQFDHIDLVDIDTSLVDEALLAVPEALRGKFQIHKADLTGIWDEFVQKMDALDQTLAPEDFLTKVKALFAGFTRKEFPYSKYKASFVVSSLVSSQLSHHLMQYLDQRCKELYGKTTLELLDNATVELMNTCVVPVEEAHMKDLSSWVAPEGRVYFADNFIVEDITTVTAPVFGEIVRTVNNTMALLAGFKIKPLAQRLFTPKRVEEWSWNASYSRANRELEIRVPRGIYWTTGVQSSYKVFTITSWILSPRSDHFSIQ